MHLKFIFEIKNRSATKNRPKIAISDSKTSQKLSTRYSLDTKSGIK